MAAWCVFVLMFTSSVGGGDGGGGGGSEERGSCGLSMARLVYCGGVPKGRLRVPFLFLSCFLFVSFLCDSGLSRLVCCDGVP